MSATLVPASGGIGRTLRQARESRGLSLRQIANTTRIAVSVLESLERDDISRLPGGIFGRAFVRSYAVEVGLDPEETIRQFIAQFPVDTVTAGHPAARPPEDGTAVESEQRTAAAFTWLLAVSVPIVALLLYLGSGARTSAPDGGGADPETAVGGAGAVPESGADARPDRLLVSLVATARCWVAVSVDGESVLARELQAGEREVVEARNEVVVTAGDAAALRLTLNGQEARPLGASGRMVTARMTLSSYKQYLAGP